MKLKEAMVENKPLISRLTFECKRYLDGKITWETFKSNTESILKQIQEN